MTSNIRAAAPTNFIYAQPLPQALINEPQEKITTLLQSPLKRLEREDLHNPIKRQKTPTEDKASQKSTHERPTQYQKISQQNTNPFSLEFANTPIEVCFEIFKKLNPEAFMNCFLINPHWNKTITSICAHLNPTDLNKICPNLTIIDAKLIKNKCNFEILGEPQINNFEVIKCVRDLTCHVMNDEGLTLLTIPPEKDINSFVLSLSGTKLLSHTPNSPIDTANQSSLNKTHRKVITNNILKDTRNTKSSQKNYRLKKHRCTMPTSNEYVFLCSLSYNIFEKLLYRANERYQTQSSTKIPRGRASSNVIVGFFIEQGKPTLRTHTNLPCHKDKAGTGALRTLSTPPT